jgi:hypothetical protein
MITVNLMITPIKVPEASVKTFLWEDMCVKLCGARRSVVYIWTIKCNQKVCEAIKNFKLLSTIWISWNDHHRNKSLQWSIHEMKGNVASIWIQGDRANPYHSRWIVHYLGPNNANRKCAETYFLVALFQKCNPSHAHFQRCHISGQFWIHMQMFTFSIIMKQSSQCTTAQEMCFQSIL